MSVTTRLKLILGETVCVMPPGLKIPEMHTMIEVHTEATGYDLWGIKHHVGREVVCSVVVLFLCFF